MYDDIYDEELKRMIDSEFKTAIHKPMVLANLIHYSIEGFKDCSIKEINRCLGVKPKSTFVKGMETNTSRKDTGRYRWTTSST